MSDVDKTDSTDEMEIPLGPLFAGHEEVYERYCEFRSEEWVEQVEGATSVYEFALAFVDSRRKHQEHKTNAR